MVKGTILRVRVNDMGQHLAKGEGAILLGLTLPTGRFHPLAVAATDATGNTFDMAIPWSTALRLEIGSHKLQLADGGLNSLAAGPVGVPVQQPAGKGDLNLTFHVTGVK